MGVWFLIGCLCYSVWFSIYVYMSSINLIWCVIKNEDEVGRDMCRKIRGVVGRDMIKMNSIYICYFLRIIF